MNPKVSIIVPVYNVEKYIRRSLDCLISQTLKEIEVILVDDGSTDESGEICEEYAARDPRFQVIQQENQGQGAARNRGIDIAQGDYILFVDPDDWYELDMAEVLWENAVETKADVVVCPHYLETIDKNGLKTTRKVGNYKEKTLKPHDALDYFRKYSFSVCWSKLYKTNLTKTNRFPEGKQACEDDVFVCRIYKNSKLFSFLEKPVYHYVRSGQMTTMKKYKINHFQRIQEILKERKMLYDEIGWKKASDLEWYCREYVLLNYSALNNLYRNDSVASEEEKQKTLRGIREDAFLKTALRITDFCTGKIILEAFLRLRYDQSASRMIKFICFLRRMMKTPQ